MTIFPISSTRYSRRACSSRRSVVAPRLASRSVSRSVSRRAGFTILEVLIAMVVLLIGGLAIMNLFPPAFNVIRGSEDHEIAMSQVKGTLARYTSDPASIPDAIYNRDPAAVNLLTNPSGFLDLGVAVEGSRTRNMSLPKTSTAALDYDDSALGHFKHIIGERHKVIQDPAGNNFVLLNYAYVYQTPIPNSLNPQVSVMDTIEGVRAYTRTVAPTGPGFLDFADATKSSDGLPFTPASGFYYTSYSWQNVANGPMQGVVDEPLTYVASPGFMQVFQGAQGKKVIDGPVTLSVFTPKPPPAVGPTGDAPIRGFLPVDSSLAPGQEIVVDYNALDWRWLVEDTSATVSTIKNKPPLTPTNPATARDIKLTVPFLGTPAAGSAAPSGYALYTLTMPAPDAQGLIANAARGGQWTGSAGAIGTDVVLDVDQTSATYDIADSTGPSKPPMVAPRVRTSYWATHGWAQQLSVAARSYYAYDAARASAISEPWREFYWIPGDNTMYFHASEAGKTIMVSFASGTDKVTNQIMTIGAKLVPTPSAVSTSGFAAAGGQVSAVDFMNADATSVVPADAITSVRGVSVRSRSAWIQNGNYTQEVAEMYRPLN